MPANFLFLAFALAITLYIPVYREHQRILARFPAVDLKPRLAYELVRSRASEASGSVQAGNSQDSLLNASPVFQPRQLQELSSEIETRRHLRTFRGEERASRAIRSLSELHAGFVADFIAQPSVFGYGRMPTMKIIRERDFEWDGKDVLGQPPQLIEQPAEQEETTASAPDLAANAAAAGEPGIAAQPAAATHGMAGEAG